ncbi:MAG: metallophosphoesterase [Paracoccaceae bacterium]|nr:metallophosphoesterase [Paracoccaceae bacterium]
MHTPVKKIKDLGKLSGEVLLFGGAYSNLPATQALIIAADQRGIPSSNCIFTGDAIGYCANPGSSFGAVLQASEMICGNVEKQLANEEADCGCGFAPDSECDAMSRDWYAFANKRLTPEQRTKMRSLPDILTFLHEGKRYAVIHGGVTNISRFIWPTSPKEEFQREIEELGKLVAPLDGVIAGHCGIAFIRRFGDLEWINPGAIGLPPNNGRRETRFVILGERGPVIHRLSYDAVSSADAIRKSDLKPGYDKALLSGFWPSEEILPPELCR